MSIALGLLWFVPIAFMFYCQHHVCEEYFIPAINCLVSKANGSPNPWVQRWGDSAVAGATIMALGCNGPELFCNLISLYIGSDAGIGVVVGSEIFNLLVIIGCSILFCPTMPLVLERASFIRDCAFYAFSIVLLVWALMINTPNQVDPSEALVLLVAEVLFVVTVYFTKDIENKIMGASPEAAVVVDEDNKPNTAIHGIAVKVTQEYCGRMQAKGGTKESWNLDVTAAGIYTEPKDAPLSVKKTGNARTSVGFAFPKDGALVGTSMMNYADLREVRVISSGIFYMEFEHNTMEMVTLKVEVPGGIDQRNELLENITQYSLGKAWIHDYNSGLFGEGGAISHFQHAMVDSTWDMKVLAVVELLADLMLKPTLACVDVKDIKKEGRWPLCFVGAMMWLAVYSFLMLEVATQINVQIPQLSMAFLGVTVCAVGTSFPNAIASILMSKQNKSAAAIANALGSNVQNVFLAMAMPWIIFMATPTSWSHYICSVPRDQWTPVPQEPPKKGQSVTEGVEWMCGTLVLVIVMALMPQTCTLSKAYGIFLCLVYVLYLIWTSYEALAPSPHAHAHVAASGVSTIFL
jgi:Ca2+/Na+ antiporter